MNCLFPSKHVQLLTTKCATCNITASGVKIQDEVFWFVVPCSAAIGYQRFGGSAV